MKSCFSTLGCTERNLSEIVSLAKEYGVAALEFRGIGSVLDARKIPDFAVDSLKATRAAIDDAGLRTAVIGTSCAFHDASGEKLAEVIDEGVASSVVAEALGARFIRVFGNRIKGPESVSKVTEGIRSLCSSVNSGIDVLLEVHGDFNTSEALSPVCDALAGCNFGLIWDICHTDSVYGDDFEPFCSRFMPLIRHIHIKDRKRNGPLCLPGDGDLPVTGILSLLESKGYDGCVSLEWEKKWHPELPPIEDALKACNRLYGRFYK